MPPLIQCSNTFCNNVVTKLGDLCPTCKKQAEKQDRPAHIDQRQKNRDRYQRRHGKR